MNDPLVREIAEKIVREEILQNWRLYVLLGSISLITSTAGNWLVAYFRKRAETYATKADLNEITAQIRATTEATEKVRVAISHADWAEKEWKTTRRMKLELLLETVYGLEGWLDDQRSHWIFGHESKPVPNPIDKVFWLGSLYFPELKDELLLVVKANRAAYSLILNAAQKANATKTDLPSRKAVLEQFKKDWAPINDDILNSIVTLNAKVPILMREIAGV
jgi:hypothetical protein